MPGIAQGGRILGAAGEPHAGGGAANRQPLPPSAGPGCLRAGERVEGTQGGAGPEGGVAVTRRAGACDRPRGNGGRRRGAGGRGIEANHNLESKVPVRFSP